MSRLTYYGPFMRPEDRKRMIAHVIIDLVVYAVAAVIVWKVILPGLHQYLAWLRPLSAVALAVVIAAAWPGKWRRIYPHW